MSKQNIFLAMGSLAYAVAKADGEIQKEELNTIRKIAQEVLFTEDISSDFIDSMFNSLAEKKISTQEAYDYALDILEANKHEYDFYDSVKHNCVHFMELIAASFQGSSTKENELIEQFKKDIQNY